MGVERRWARTRFVFTRLVIYESRLIKVIIILGANEAGFPREKSWGAFHQQFTSERGDGRRFSQAKCPYDCDYVIDY